MIVFFSCKKISNDTAALEADQGYAIKNGIVTFTNVASYLKVIEDKNKDWQTFSEKMSANNFVALKTKPQADNQSSFVAGAINQFTNAFDQNLYTDYLLSVLNTDKICSVNGYWVKVDMDNEFCSALDATLYPNEFNDLLNNAFANTHIMVFKNADEPVLDVLSEIKSNKMTWSDYQVLLSRKTNNPGGICFRRGASADSKSEDLLNIPVIANFAAGVINSKVSYIKNFISFTLNWNSKVRRNFPPIITICNKSVSFRVRCQYEFEGACKGSGNGDSWYDNINQDCNEFSGTVYQGGSALYIRKIRLYTYARFGSYSNNLFDYIYSNTTNGYTPLSIGY
jgi:hypothetical protein